MRGDPRQLTLGAVEAQPLSRRLTRIALWVGGSALAIFILDLLGVPVDDWIAELFRKLGEIPPWAIVAGVVLQTVNTCSRRPPGSGSCGPTRLGGVSYRIVLASYATAVALNGFLPANIGTWVMLLMFTALFAGATFPMMVSGIVVQKIPFTVFNMALYLYLFLSVSRVLLGRARLPRRPHRPRRADRRPAGSCCSSCSRGSSGRSSTGCVNRYGRRDGAGTPRRVLARCRAPALGSYLARLAVVGVFLAAYSIPATFHNIATVTASNSISNTVSATPGGVGVTQAMNSVALAGSTNAATATAYSISQQLVTSAWNIVFAVVLVSWVFGWTRRQSAGRVLLRRRENEKPGDERTAQNASEGPIRSRCRAPPRRGRWRVPTRTRSDGAASQPRRTRWTASAPTTSSAGHSRSAGWRTKGKDWEPPRPPCEPTNSSKAATSANRGQ